MPIANYNFGATGEGAFEELTHVATSEVVVFRLLVSMTISLLICCMYI